MLSEDEKLDFAEVNETILDNTNEDVLLATLLNQNEEPTHQQDPYVPNPLSPRASYASQELASSVPRKCGEFL